MGDIGHINEDGYLFITDRKANMIISGGVNIYPQESENRLLSHPEIRDVAVIGVPNSDFGEEVKGIVQLTNPETAGKGLAQELIEYCWETVSKIKSPRSIDFVTDLPRRENGKLYKKLLKQQYWK
jgi:long-chain acyl-CoA synthetase